MDPMISGNDQSNDLACHLQHVDMNLKLNVPEGFRVEKKYDSGSDNEFRITYCPNLVAHRDEESTAQQAPIRPQLLAFMKSCPPPQCSPVSASAQMQASSYFPPGQQSAAQGFGGATRISQCVVPFGNQCQITSKLDDIYNCNGYQQGPILDQQITDQDSLNCPPCPPCPGEDQPTSTEFMVPKICPSNPCPPPCPPPCIPIGQAQEGTSALPPSSVAPNQQLQRSFQGPGVGQQTHESFGSTNLPFGTEGASKSYLPFNIDWDKCSDVVRITGKPKACPKEIPPCPPPPPPPPKDFTKVNVKTVMDVKRGVGIIDPELKKKGFCGCQPDCSSNKSQTCEDPTQKNLMSKLMGAVGPDGQVDPTKLDDAPWLVPEKGTVKMEYKQKKPFGLDPDTWQLKPNEGFCLCPDGTIVQGPADAKKNKNYQDSMNCTLRQQGFGDRPAGDQTLFGPDKGIELQALSNQCPDDLYMKQVCGPNDQIDSTNIRPDRCGSTCCDSTSNNFQRNLSNNPSLKYQPLSMPSSPILPLCDPECVRSRTLMDIAFFFYVWLFCIAGSQVFKLFQNI